MSLLQNLPQPRCSQIQIPLCRLLRLLLKRMQDVNCRSDMGDVEDAKRSILIAYSYLPNASPHRRHRLPVAWLKSQLDLVQLNTCFFPCAFGKIPQLFQRVSQKLQSLHFNRPYIRICINRKIGLFPAFCGFIVRWACVDPGAFAAPVFAFPERRAGLEIVHQEFAGFERRATMR